MRIPLPVLPTENRADLVPCLECGKCCTYVAIEIDGPKSVKAATEILWYLYHEKVSVYRDGDGSWNVQFESRCRHLQSDLLCAIYESRPHICRDFDEQTCEVNTTGGRTFEDAQTFLDYLRAEHPRVYRGVEKKYLPARPQAV